MKRISYLCDTCEYYCLYRKYYLPSFIYNFQIIKYILNSDSIVFKLCISNAENYFTEVFWAGDKKFYQQIHASILYKIEKFLTHPPHSLQKDKDPLFLRAYYESGFIFLAIILKQFIASNL